MPLRDDHDAAIARADALQVELDRERAKDRAQDEQIRELEADVLDAKRRLARAEEALGKLKPRARPEPAKLDAARVDAARVDAGRAGAATTTATSDATTAAASTGVPRGAVLMLVIGCVIILAVLMTMASRRDQRAAYAPAPKTATGPFRADELLAKGLLIVNSDEQVRAIHVEYVGADGLLDPVHGRLGIDTQRPPRPKQPDDPNRPTGAPIDHSDEVADMIAMCNPPSWNPSRGWSTGMGSCRWFEKAKGLPGCTVAEILALARRDDAPAGLATLAATWSDEGGWSWRFAISDAARGVEFSRDYPDRCR